MLSSVLYVELLKCIIRRKPNFVTNFIIEIVKLSTTLFYVFLIKITSSLNELNIGEKVSFKKEKKGNKFYASDIKLL